MGYIFCILGGIVGLIIAIYLATRKDPVAKKHGRIQLGILILYVLIIALAILICMSTVMIKQHAFMDIVWALVLAIVIYSIGKWKFDY